MRSRPGLFILLAVLLCASQLSTGCTGGNTPTFVETGTPESRIVVKTDPWDNCDSSGPVPRKFETKDTRSQETAWWAEGKAGVGGKVPLGFLIPSLDIETSITSHYGSKETRTWENIYTDEFTVPGYTNTILVVFYQEITRKGIIQYYNKEIEFEYPAEVTILDHRKVDVDCNRPPAFQIMCLNPLDGSSPTLQPSFAELAGTWRLASPSTGEIAELEIGIQNANVTLHVQTDGSSGLADWGVQYQCVWGDPMEVKFDHLLFKNTTLTIHQATGGELRATVVDQYTNQSIFIPPQTTEYIFTR